MKIGKVCLSLLAFVFFISGCVLLNVIQGDGNLLTEEITVSDFNKIAVSGAGVMVFNYEQKDAEPYLKITVDKNIYDLLEIKVTDGKLTIYPKDKNMNIQPTEFTVTSNSRNLNSVKLAGGCKFNVNSTLNANKLELDVAGSGTISLKGDAVVAELDTDIAGSGTIEATNITAQKSNSDIAGSGTLILNGQIGSSSFDIAGSGDVLSFGCKFTDVSCNIAGSGNIEVTVESTLKSSIAGSGDIKYKGNPNLTSKIAGSGDVRKVD